MGNRVKRLAILGSTGSIGRQALDVVRASPGRFRIVALAAGKNRPLLAKQIKEFHPELVYYEPSRRGVTVPLEGGELAPLDDIARHKQVDIVVIAAPGKAGLSPTLAAARAGKTIALANKESLVMAGGIITRAARQSGAQIRPVDSEHSAIWQCLQGETAPPARLILTASGGPFHRCTRAQLKRVTVAEALQHPSWRMGRKITVDSATLMNKGLEIIEAHWLFGMPFDDVEVIVHPQSIIHSMVEFADGSFKAQLGYPDMRLPIQYALSYPDRLANPALPRLDWNRIGCLDFEQPDLSKFPCLRLAMEAGRRGDTYPAALCGADEAAVELFLAGRIGFTDIAHLVELILAAHRPTRRPGIEAIVAADARARQEVYSMANGGNPC